MLDGKRKKNKLPMIVRPVYILHKKKRLRCTMGMYDGPASFHGSMIQIIAKAVVLALKIQPHSYLV